MKKTLLTPTLILMACASFAAEPDAKVNGNAAASHAWLGATADELSDELRAQLPLAAGTGVLVRGVAADSPAAKAGLLKNDVLAKFDDQLLTNAQQFRTLIGTKKAGDIVHLTYFRHGKEASAKVKLASHEGEEVVNQNGSVVANDGQPEKGDVAKQLEKTLRDVGVDQKTIDQTKKALSDTSATLQKAAGDVNVATGDVMEQLQKAVEQAKRAIEETKRDAAKREAADAAAKAATPPPKAP